MTYEQHRELIFQQVQDFSGEGFGDLAMEVFRFQARHNALYARYLSLLGLEVSSVQAPGDIPFLPIQFFKNYTVKTGQWQEAAFFSSSGTTGASTSRHPVRDLDFYKNNTVKGFQQFYGPSAAYCVLALLPSYLERSGSSLVCMAEHFISLSTYPQSGFFLKNTGELVKVLGELQAAGIPLLLLGVSFALLDLAGQFDLDLKNTIVMETGGMKGRRRELTRDELHAELKNAFKVKAIHSEYGMTELFSQAYSKGNGQFYPAHTMQVFAREVSDPLAAQAIGKTGVLNIIDLANFDTCSFIATEDLGRVWDDGSFEVLGRLDNSDIRGCNLMVGTS
jgi:phenylacetate-coenzyme A ligase PaaK-like adenylate-forming protein